MTDPKPTRRAAAKPDATDAGAAKVPAAKVPAAKKPATKPATAKPAAAKTSATRAPAAKSTAGKTTTAAKKPAARRPAAKSPATTPAARASAVPPVEAAPVFVAPAAAAPAGWYPVAPGSAQQRWWDGSAWTEHVHDPAAVRPAAATVVGQLKAPEGPSPSTVWFWLTAASPVIAAVSYIFLSVYFAEAASQYANSANTFDDVFASPTYDISLLIWLVSLVAAIVFPILDWRALEKRGVPKPFHWAWSLAVLVLSTPIIYVIGRTVVARRRTGKGMAPLWVFIALQVVAWIIGIIAIAVFFVALFADFAALFNDSNEVF